MEAAPTAARPAWDPISLLHVQPKNSCTLYGDYKYYAFMKGRLHCTSSLWAVRLGGQQHRCTTVLLLSVDGRPGVFSTGGPDSNVRLHWTPGRMNPPPRALPLLDASRYVWGVFPDCRNKPPLHCASRYSWSHSDMTFSHPARDGLSRR